MKRYLIFLLFLASGSSLLAQKIYTIQADSTKLTGCDSNELIIENHTQGVPGFLFNKGQGRTEFRHGLFSLNDSLYVSGADTLNFGGLLNDFSANNGVQYINRTMQFGNDTTNPYGGPAYQFRPTFYNQNSSIFDWITGPDEMLNIGKGLYSTQPETNVLAPYYVARFSTVYQQCGILMESNLTNYYSAPLNWISFKNNDPNAIRYSFFGDSVAAQFGTGTREGVDGHAYTECYITIADDTAYSNTGYDNAVLKLYPSFNEASGGVFKIPTAIVKRLDITDGTAGFDNYNAETYDNPYSRLVIDAKNYPLVTVNLPGISLDTVNNKPLVINPSTGAIQYTYWSSTPISGADVKTSPATWASYKSTNGANTEGALLKRVEQLENELNEQREEIAELKRMLLIQSKNMIADKEANNK